LDPGELFLQKKLVCDCGACDFDAYYEIVEKGLSDNYVFYCRCQACGSHWLFASAVSHLKHSSRTPYFSDPKEIAHTKWKLLEVEKKIPLSRNDSYGK
jgi:hypothetical protein